MAMMLITLSAVLLNVTDAQVYFPNGMTKLFLHFHSENAVMTSMDSPIWRILKHFLMKFRVSFKVQLILIINNKRIWNFKQKSSSFWNLNKICFCSIRLNHSQLNSFSQLLRQFELMKVSLILCLKFQTSFMNYPSIYF